MRLAATIAAALLLANGTRHPAAEVVQSRSAARVVRILSSNAIKPVMEELIAAFEREAQIRVSVEYGVSADLKRRIDDGAAFDLAILTPPLIDDLIAKGRVARDTRTVVARSPMALAVRAGGPKPEVRTTEQLSQTLVATTSIALAREGASAAYFHGLVERLGLTERLARKYLLTETGAQASAAVSDGSAELAVLPVSEILAAPGTEVLATFPADVQGYIVMVAGAHRSGDQAIAAIVKVLTSAQAKAIMAKRGLEM